MKKLVLAMVVLGLICALGYSQPRSQKMPKKMIEELQLTPEQAQKFEAQNLAERKKISTKFTQLRKLHESLDVELCQEKLDTAKLDKLTVDIKTLQAEIAEVHLNSLLETRQIITAEQYKKMVTLRKDFEKKRKDKTWFEKKQRASKAKLVEVEQDKQDKN